MTSNCKYHPSAINGRTNHPLHGSSFIIFELAIALTLIPNINQSMGRADRVVLSEDCKSFVSKVRLLRIPCSSSVHELVHLSVSATPFAQLLPSLLGTGTGTRCKTSVAKHALDCNRTA